MASAVKPQLLHGKGGGLTSSAPVDKDPALSLSTTYAPPSPPATDTDTETDSEAPNAPLRGPEMAGGADASASASASTSTPNDRLEVNTSDNSPNGSPITSPITSPPYWIHNHTRTVSNTSVESIPTGAITLRDNENSSIDERGNACWAKSVQVTDYVTVNGSTTNIGAFVVFNIKVETLNGSYMNIRKRYSEFDDFRWRLIRTFPGFEAAVPELPPKSLVSKFRPRFLEKRRAGLQYFLNCILLNPEFSGSPVLKEFLFS